MKKLFCIIGILIAIFSVFFSFLIADKQIHLNSEKVNDFILNDCFITLNELNDIAIASDTQIQIRTYGYINFGHSEIDIIILNTDNSIKSGIQPSIFPNNKINYILDNFNYNTNIQYFMIQENDQGKLDMVNNLLSSRNLSYDILVSQPVIFDVSMLFSPLNAKFFILLLILLILCIISYYTYRLKEIGILKLNGWSDFKISLKIMKEMSIRTILSCLVIMLAFCVFIVVQDISILTTYIYLCIMLLVSTLAVFILSCILAPVFISKINNVMAIKNGRNNKALFFLLIIAKLSITLMIFISVNNLSINIQNSINLIESSNHLRAYNFYYIHTSFSPDEQKIKQINDYLATLPDDDVYNYGSMGNIYSLREIKKGNMELNSYNIIDESNGMSTYTTVSVSDNLLGELKVTDLSGQIISKKDKMTIFIPEHLKAEKEQILSSLGIAVFPNAAYDDSAVCADDIYVEYIKDRQIVQDLLYPDSYLFDPIIISYPVRKSLYQNGGVEVLYNQRAVNGIENELLKLKVDPSTCNIAQYKSQIDLSISNEVLAASENLFLFILNLLSYLLSGISVVTIYFELKKKAFGVYALMGKLPFKLTVPLILLNSIIVSVFALYINTRYLIFAILETVLYFIWAQKYIKTNAVSSIKGE